MRGDREREVAATVALPLTTAMRDYLVAEETPTNRQCLIGFVLVSGVLGGAIALGGMRYPWGTKTLEMALIILAVLVLTAAFFAYVARSAAAQLRQTLRDGTFLQTTDLFRVSTKVRYSNNGNTTFYYLHVGAREFMLGGRLETVIVGMIEDPQQISVDHLRAGLILEVRTTEGRSLYRADRYSPTSAARETISG